MECLKYMLPLLALLVCCYRTQMAEAKNVQLLQVDETTVFGDEVAARTTTEEAAAVNKINITLTSIIHEIDARYLSAAMSPTHIFGDFGGSQKMVNMAAALAPLELRLGGTHANFMTYIPDKITNGTAQQTIPLNEREVDYIERQQRTVRQFTVSATVWDHFNLFLKKVNWDLLFDVNNFKRTKSGEWDPTNFEQLLNDSSAKGIPIAHFQLGNEPNAYGHNFKVSIPAETLVANLKTMKSILSRYPLYANSKICGPDVSDLRPHNGPRNYLYNFLNAGGYDVIDEICLHYYYGSGYYISVESFLDPSVMDQPRTHFGVAGQLNNATPKPRPILLTETASASGGGRNGMTDRYVDGFLWLDELGLSAAHKATRIYRQAFFGSYYGLFDSYYNPYPDYFLSLLYKELVEGPVFKIGLETRNYKLRLYANCASKRRYTPGALVVYYLNVNDTDAILSLPQFPDADLDLYMLTPGDEGGLTSEYVKLNGNKLVLTGDELPTLSAQPHKGDVTVPAKTFGFIVIPQAKVSFCVNYFNKLDSNSQGQ